MKRMKWIFAALLPFFFTGCLTVDTIKTRIQIQDEKKPAILTIEYFGISSSEAKDDDVRGDFDQLLVDWKGYQYLIDRAKEGIVVSDRKVLEENNQINASMTGFVDALDKLHDFNFWVENNERILLVDFDEEDFELVETNGKIFKTDHNRLIWWSETEKNLYWTMKRISESESIEDNRPVMAKLFREYLKKEKQ